MPLTKVWPGSPHPLGATWDGEGVNFALFSEHADAVEVHLFEEPGDARESARIPLRFRSETVWHAYVPGLRPGQLYGYRVYGPYAPERGLRFNPAKLLLDPYARAISHPLRCSPELFGYPLGDPRQDAAYDPRNSAGAMPKCVVVDPSFDWEGVARPRTPWHRTVIYELHVKGMTWLHPEVPPHLRGTYLGLCAEPVIEHLKSLGVTAVELLPVHHRVDEHHLFEKGLTNYWGYSTIGFFAPDVRFATAGRGEQVNEFKEMVKTFHRHGLEVIIDVVYNHSGEGDQLGPTLSFRGIDNPSYYHLVKQTPRHYMDYTGCGNTLDVHRPRTLQLLMDSLRYWAGELDVDGFRFDLAPAMARGLRPGDQPMSAFFAVIQQDPLLQDRKLIAEPWDLGKGGYMLGAFPPGWSEWNGKYRDAVRRFWRGDHGVIGEVASRLAGSSDVFGAGKRRAPSASVNYITCHDGFTLHDLVSYEHKHNEANKEDNRDGNDANWSRNWGVEGPSDDERVVDLRERIKRNLMATLAFSQGVPMISMGDEMGRTQGGNNNAYCQDNEISWLDWDLDDRRRRLLDFARKVFAIRRAQPGFRRRAHFDGLPVDRSGERDLTWLRSDGTEMTHEDWHRPDNGAVGMLIHGGAVDAIDESGQPLSGDTLLVLLNAEPLGQPFRMPRLSTSGRWRLVLTSWDRSQEQDEGPEMTCEGAEIETGLTIPAHALALLSFGVARDG